jgi:PPK2 family polyphosphate:nucleotide phosphotransferase
MFSSKLLARFRIDPGERFRARDRDAGWRAAPELRDLSASELKEKSKRLVQRSLEELTRAQELLYANDVYAVLVVFQAMDAAGKDGVIKHVMSGLNPLGCQAHAFKAPSAEELDHDFLWRCVTRLPERGRIGVFNRSYYEEVLVARVHPELLARQRLPPGPRGPRFWQARYESIAALERHLVRNGTVLLKFFLHLSKGEQRRRFLERIENPDKHWKFAAQDVAERRHWGAYMRAYEDAINATSTAWAPWHVIPADHKWLARALVADILSTTIGGLHLAPPRVSKARRRELAAARRALRRE